MARCKITVLKTALFQDLADEYVTRPGYGPCSRNNVGDVYYTGGHFGTDMPEGFCPQAWESLVMPVNVLVGGGKVFGFDEVHIASCADGLRPVVFRLERAEDDI